MITKNSSQNDGQPPADLSNNNDDEKKKETTIDCSQQYHWHQGEEVA